MGILTYFKRNNVLFVDYTLFTALLLGQMKKKQWVTITIITLQTCINRDHCYCLLNGGCPLDTGYDTFLLNNDSKTNKSLTIITELEIMWLPIPINTQFTITLKAVALAKLIYWALPRILCQKTHKLALPFLQSFLPKKFISCTSLETNYFSSW